VSTDPHLTFEDDEAGDENGKPEKLDPNMALPAGDGTLEAPLPSGLVGRIRPWRPRDLRFFADRATIVKPLAIEAQILKATWVETLDLGPYAFTGTPPWLTDILVGDTTEAIRRGRILTHGPKYAVDFPCERPGCSERIPYDADLAGLEMVPLSAEARASFEAGNEFSWRFPECKREVVYSLPTGRTQNRAMGLARKHKMIDEVGWASVIKKIEGSTPGLFVEFLGDLSFADSNALSEELDRHDCGVRTKVSLVCPGLGCGWEQHRELRFGPNFYKPGDGERDLLA
jgi:hypothetical protein